MTEIISNANHPLERVVVGVVDGFIEKSSYPMGRLPLAVHFGYNSTMFSRHDISKVEANKFAQLEGKPMLLFNLLYLMQNPAFYIERVVRHEYTHLITELAAKAKNEKVEPHGEEFLGQHMKLTGQVPDSHNEILDAFDPRPIKLWKHNHLVRCECSGKSGFDAVNDKTSVAVRAGNKICKRCGEAYRLAAMEELHSELKDQIDFMRFERGQRKLY